MGTSIMRLDEVEWDRGVPNTLDALNMWGVKPLILLIEAALAEVDEEPGHFLVNEIGQKAQDLSTVINKLAATYEEDAKEPEPETSTEA